MQSTMSLSFSLVKLGHEAAIFSLAIIIFPNAAIISGENCLSAVFGMRHTFTHACKKATAHRGRWGAAAVASSDHRDVAGRLREVAVF